MPASAGLDRPGRSHRARARGSASLRRRDLPVSAGKLGDYVKGLTFAKGTDADVTGEWPVWADFNKTNEQALHKAELLSGIPSVILLLIAFGSLAAAGLPLLLAVAGIAVGFATLHLIGLQLPLSVWAMNFSMMIGLAVGIDYSLFIVSRYREEREAGAGPIDGVANTLGTAGKAVFLSALTVVFSLAAVFVVPVMVFRSMALGMILSVVAVALASLTLLPAVLVALGDRVLVTRGHEDPDVAAESRWARITGVALRRPALTLATGVVVLAVLAAPALGMRLGMPGARVVDTGHTSRDGYDTLVAAFGPGAAAPVLITTPASAGRPGRSDRARPVRGRGRPHGHPARGRRPGRRPRDRLDPGRRLRRRQRSSGASATASGPRFRLRASADRPRRTTTSRTCSPAARRSRSGSSWSSRSSCCSSCSAAWWSRRSRS